MRRTTIEQAKVVVDAYKHFPGGEVLSSQAAAAEIDKLIDAAVSDALAEQREQHEAERRQLVKVALSDAEKLYATDKQRAVEEALTGERIFANGSEQRAIEEAVAKVRETALDKLAAERSRHSQIVEEARREERQRIEAARQEAFAISMKCCREAVYARAAESRISEKAATYLIDEWRADTPITTDMTRSEAVNACMDRYLTQAPDMAPQPARVQPPEAVSIRAGLDAIWNAGLNQLHDELTEDHDALPTGVQPDEPPTAEPCRICHASLTRHPMVVCDRCHQGMESLPVTIPDETGRLIFYWSTAVGHFSGSCKCPS